MSSLQENYNTSFKFNELASELRSLGLRTSNLNELNDIYELENLVDNLKQTLYVEYKSTSIFTD
jgi:hypothetical protein